MVNPTGCSGGTGTMETHYRFSTTLGDTLEADLCTEGSTMWIYVDDGSIRTVFQCWRRTGNHNVCQRYW